MALLNPLLIEGKLIPMIIYISKHLDTSTVVTTSSNILETQYVNIGKLTDDKDPLQQQLKPKNQHTEDPSRKESALTNLNISQ